MNTPSVSTPKDQAREDEHLRVINDPSLVGRVVGRGDGYITIEVPGVEHVTRAPDAFEVAASVSPSPADPVRAALVYTSAVGDAAEAYLKSVAYQGQYNLPARCRFYELFDVMVRAALSVSTPTAAIMVGVQTMKTSKGADYYVCVACGDRSCTPHMFLDRYKAEYEAAHWQWIFGQREEEPSILDYSEETYPNLYPKMEIPPVSTPTGEGEAAGDDPKHPKAIDPAIRDEIYALRKAAHGAEERTEYATKIVPTLGLYDAMRIAATGFKAWAGKPQNAKWARKIDGTPIPNDLPINIAQAFVDAGVLAPTAPTSPSKSSGEEA